MSDNALLRYLRGLEPEFKFLDGLEGGSHIRDLASHSEALPDAVQRWHDEYHTKSRAEAFRNFGKSTGDSVNVKRVQRDWQAASKMANRIYKTTKDSPPVRSGNRWPYPWPVHHFVWQAREGAGKSSIVGELVKRGFTVVFCSKTNDQLVEHEKGFAERWPEMRIHRHRSRARNMQEQLATIGIDFVPVYHPPRSPYSPAVVDPASTRQALHKVLTEAGYDMNKVNVHEIFERLYNEYKAPPVPGNEVDVVLMTLTSFQAYCTARHRPWWHALGLLKGEKRIRHKYKEHEDDNWAGKAFTPWIIPSTEPTPAFDDQGLPLVGVELGIDGIVVIIDDPDRTDFDFRRLIEDDELADIHRRAKALDPSQRDFVKVEHWLKEYPPLMAQKLADTWTKKAQELQIEAASDQQFEERPFTSYIGYGLQRGFRSKDGNAPKIMVTTTEHITAKLAYETLGQVQRWSRNTIDRYSDSRKYPKRPDPNCHVTLLMTKLIRKADRALLLLIEGKLQEEFGDGVLIADGIGCELNLMNNRGRNDLTEKSTIVKLSVPNPIVAANLWAQFPGGDRRNLNTILLADLANQAIGRNQGFRFAGKPCVVLIDPMYAHSLVHSGLLRYTATPWSFHKPAGQALPTHGPMTELEKRLMYWLVPANARKLGTSVDGFKIGVKLSEKAREIYEEWLDRNSQAEPGILKRWEARQ